MPKSVNSIQGRRVLITGGCGFIGSHLAERLSKAGAAHITLLDSMLFGKEANLDPKLPRIQIMRHTLGPDSAAILEAACKDIDAIFHLAAEKHNQAAAREVDLINTNIHGTLKLFQAAAKAKVKKIVFSSSLYAYGKTCPGFFDESMRAQPHSLYGISKLAGELLLNKFREETGIQGVSLRFFFVYGPRQFTGTGYKSVIVKNFERIIKDESPVIFGDGQQALDYIYIDDVVESCLRAMESDLDGQVLNIANARAVEIKELTEMMLAVAGRNLKPVFGPRDETHGTRRAGSNELMKSLLGFEPAVPLEKGLSETYAWIKESTV